MNVDISETVTVAIEGTTVLAFPQQNVTETKNGDQQIPLNYIIIYLNLCGVVFIATGGLQVVGVGAIAARLQASKNATFRCRLNDGEFVDCK